MARTTKYTVEAILGDNFDGKSDLSPFIATANSIVTRLNNLAIENEITISTTDLELIERWLACHCYVIMDQLASSESRGGASITYQGQTGMNLEGSKYGQMALNLDPTGLLSAISQKLYAGGFWAGTKESNQLTHEERNQ